MNEDFCLEYIVRVVVKANTLADIRNSAKEAFNRLESGHIEGEYSCEYSCYTFNSRYKEVALPNSELEKVTERK